MTNPDLQELMKKRIDVLAENGCDGIDPDNTDGYLKEEGSSEDKTGFNLTHDDLVNYLKTLAKYAHSKGLSMGLKNSIEIAPRLVNATQWVVNEECAQWDADCKGLRVFIEADKPVFRVVSSPTPPITGTHSVTEGL